MRAVVLDMDDTLYDECDYAASGFGAVADHLGRPRFAEVAWEIFMAGERLRVFDHALDAVGIPVLDSLIAECVDVYRNHSPSITLREDARWLLENLAPTVPLALVSDGYLNTQRLKFAALGVAQRFASVVFSDALGRDCWKPSPVPYLEVSCALGLAPEEHVYVGDNPQKDFVSPRRMGWSTVQLESPRRVHRGAAVAADHQAHHSISSLRELAGLPGLDHLFTS